MVMPVPSAARPRSRRATWRDSLTRSHSLAVWYTTGVLVLWVLWSFFLLGHAIAHRGYRWTYSNGYYDSGPITYGAVAGSFLFVAVQLAVFGLAFGVASVAKLPRERRLRLATLTLVVVDIPLGLFAALGILLVFVAP